MLKFIAAALITLTMSACSTNALVNNETNKLIGTAIGATLNPSTSKEATAALLKQCAALQARILACQSLAQGAEICISNAKAQSPVTSQCVL